MAPSPNKPWTPCKICMAKGEELNCRLCEELNGRPMTPEEEHALLLSRQLAWEQANPGWENYEPFPE